jgi:hypothetical protein
MIIDKMYNICHYYYVLGIYALLNSDITPEIKVDPKIDEAVKLFQRDFSFSEKIDETEYIT